MVAPFATTTFQGSTGAILATIATILYVGVFVASVVAMAQQQHLEAGKVVVLSNKEHETKGGDQTRSREHERRYG
jgi:hypothetical protein